MIKKNKINYHPVRLFITIVLIVLFTVIMTYNNIQLNNKIINDTNDASYESIGNLTAFISDDIMTQINYHNNTMKNIITSLNHIENHSDRIEYLNEISLKSQDVWYGICDINGDLSIIGHPEETANVKMHHFFSDALNGQAVIDINDKLFKNFSSTLIVFSQPVTYIDKDSISGVFCCFVKPSSILNSLTIDSYNAQALLTDYDKTIIAYTDINHDNSSNMKPLYEIISDPIYYNEYLRADVYDENKTNYFTYGDTSQYIYRTTLDINDWVLYTSVRCDLISSNAKTFSLKSTLTNTIYIFAVIALLLCYLLPVIIEANKQRIADSRSMLLANVSHELRTPLNTIIGISEILARSKLNKGQMREVSYIADAGKSLLAMINDILDLTKIQANRFELAKERYDLESLIYDLTTVASVRLNEKPVKFLVYISSYVPRNVIGDIMRVRQIINNVITNAAKYTEKGHIIVTVDCENIDNDSINLIVKVKDTGIGMTKDNIEHLFDNFSRFDIQKNKSIEGTGLGMPIAKQFAELMNGNISVESTYGYGSEFTITIVQGIAGNETLIPQYSPKTPSDSILILEKSQLLRNYYTKCLEDTLVNYYITDDNYEFSQCLNETEYNYVLADSETISMLREEFGTSNKFRLISLIHDHADTVNDGDTLYIPLFTLQLYAYLSGQKHISHSHLPGQSFIIRPMPEKRILLVDDNSMNLQVATGIMEPYKMQIHCAESGEQALKMVQEKDYDLIFMDHMMPGLDGEETLNAIRRLDGAKYKTVPIIALTANASTGAEKMFLNMGFQDFIAKPLELLTLNQVIYKWLKPENEDESIEYAPATPEIETEIADIGNELDFNQGLARIGSMPLYLKTLRNFCDTIPKKHEIISKSFPDDIKTFVIEVHGLKGLAAMVSANELAQQSLKLEMMGKNEDIDSISPLLDDYLSYMLDVKMCAERFIEQYT